MAFKTPGVFIEEISTFPPSVVPVETAIPAFVGYTEKAQNEDGQSLSFVPTRVRSLLEFREKFGDDFVPSSYDVEIADATGANTVGPISSRDGNGKERRYYLYGCVRHFHANGGGACYIVSVGGYTDEPVTGEPSVPSGLLGGLFVLERFDEPTLLVCPDSVSLSESGDYQSVQDTALAQCEKLQDRFVIMDVREGNLEATVSSDPVENFRDEVGTNGLRYGAAYYPWLRTVYRPEVRFRELDFFDATDVTDATPAPIADKDIDELTGDTAVDGLVPAVRTADDNVTAVVAAVNAVSMAGGVTLSYSRSDFGALSQDFATRLEVLRRTESTPPEDLSPPFRDLLLVPRGIALAFNVLQGAGLPAEVDQIVQDLSTDKQLQTTIVALIALEKNVDTMRLVDMSNGRDVDDVAADYASLDGTTWIDPHPDTGAVVANTDVLAGADDKATALNVASALQEYFDVLAAAILSPFEAAEFLADEVQQQLFDQHPVMRDVAERIRRTMSVLPAAGAVAGVYAAVDRTRGVWKAPANVSLTDLSGPAVKINDAAQGSLNVHTSGKSVNAIRAFAGRGTLIWGARTLAGNDNEWRYVPVRRFFNLAEESIKKATEPFTFEPNDANTWVRVRAMIENFLTVQWRQGALAGATTAQAFFVKLGLGETMTAQDILEGRMVVEIGMAVVRPAEFIILKFAHKMQVS